MTNFLEQLKMDVRDEYEKLKFLKYEVKRLNKENERLTMESQMAYSCGYSDSDTGRDYDINFRIDEQKD